MRKSKNRFFSRTAAHIFVSPGNAPVTITQYVARMERQFNACQTPCSMYLSILNTYRVIRCLSQCVSPIIAIFYHIFVSPGDGPGAITLNVVCMEREFDAYKLPRCMCPSNYNRFWDRARYWSKIVNFSYPLLFDAPIRGVPVGLAPPCFVRKNWNGVATRWWKNFEDIFIHFAATHERDRQTDRHCVPAIATLCIASHGKNVMFAGVLGQYYFRTY